MYICICICMCVYIYIYIYKYTHAHVYVYIINYSIPHYIIVYNIVRELVDAVDVVVGQPARLSALAWSDEKIHNTYIYIYIHIWTYICMCMYIYIYIYIYTCTYRERQGGREIGACVFARARRTKPTPWYSAGACSIV